MNNTSSSMPQGQGYVPEGESYALDHQLLNLPTSGWSGDYGQNTGYTQQPYQPQFARPPVQQYSNYGAHQPSTYSVQPYSSAYGPQFQHPNQIEAYGLPQYAVSSSQVAAAPQSYISGTDPFLFSNIAVEAPTVSPQALQRVDLSNVRVHPTNHSFDDGQQTNSLDPNTVFHHEWNGGSARGFAPPQVQQSQTYQQVPDQGSQITYRLSNQPIVDKISHQGDGADSDGETNKITLSRKGRHREYAVVVDQDLLNILNNNLSRRMANAPYVLVDEVPILLDSGAKTTGLKSKSRNSRSKNQQPSEVKIKAPKKPRVSKLAAGESKIETPSLAKHAQAKDQKSRIGPDIAAKITESPPSSDSDSSIDDQSSTGSDSDEESAETMHQETLNDIRGEERPTDIPAAATWDTIGIVWFPAHHIVNRQEIVGSTTKFEKLFCTLRDDLKVSSADLVTAETEKRLGDVEKLKNARDARRKALYNAIQAANTHGNRHILQYLSGSEKLVNSLTTILRNCIKTEDFNGDLPRAVLRLMACFTTLREHLLVKVKFDAIEKRFNKKGDAEIKDYIATVRSNTQAAETKAKAAEESNKPEKIKTASPTPETLKLRKAEDTLKAPPVSGTKRSHEPDGIGSQPNKKIVSDTSTVGQTQKIPASTAKVRSTNYFDNLKRSTVRPGAATKVLNQTSAAPKPEPKPTPKPAPKPEPPSTPQSSLAAILASIEKPREDPKLPEAPAGPPETPEEKAKRERKESRRHLRVRWKDGDALVETRLFKHEQAEDEGRQEDMLRDAHDDRSEGMMHRQRVLQTMAKSADTLDDEDDAGEVEYRPYHELTPIDFSVMPTERCEMNFTTRGGQVSFTTPQQRIQNQRESLELMVVYTDPKDIPPSAKEPPHHESAGVAPVERAFGLPTAPWLRQRIQEIYLYGAENAMSIFFGKLGEQKPTIGITEILNAMKGNATQPAHQQFCGTSQLIPQNLTSPYDQLPYQQQSQLPPQMSSSGDNNKASDADPFAGLYQIVQSLRGKPFPPTEPPAWMNDHGKAMWLEGYNRDKAASDKKAEGTAPQMQSFQSQHAQAPQMQAPQMQAPQMQTPQMQAPQMQAPQMQAPQMQAPQMQAPQMQAPQMQAPQMQAPQMQTPQMQAPQMQMQAPQMQMQAPQIQTQIQSQMQIPQTQASLMQTTQMQAPQMQYPQMPYSNMQYSQPQYPQPQYSQAQYPQAQFSQVQYPQAQYSQMQSQPILQHLSTTTNATPSFDPKQVQDILARLTQGMGGNGNDSQGYTAQPFWNTGFNNTNANANESTHQGYATTEGNRPSYNTPNQDNGQKRWDGTYGGSERHRSTTTSDYKRGTKPCKFWQEGKCAKGESCTFRHDFLHG